MLMHNLIILLCLLLTSCSGKMNDEPTLSGQEKPKAAPTLSAAYKNPNVLMYKMERPVTSAAQKEAATGANNSARQSTMKLARKNGVAATPSQDAIIAQLANASMIFALPEKSNIKDNIRAQLIIDVNKTADELAKSIDSNLRVKGNVKVSKIIIAKLVAPDFTVTPITPEEQALTQDEPTEWLWDLDAKEAGSFTTNLVITAVVKVDDKSAVHNIKTFSKDLTIEIKPQQRFIAWIEKYWQWCVSSLVLPIIAWLAKIWFTKDKKKEEEFTE